VLDHFNSVETTMDVKTYDGKNGSSRPGTLVRHNDDAPSADDHINKAHANAEAVYQWYNAEFKRDSLDDKGLPLVSTVHYSKNYNNAFWDGKQMTYGDGDGKFFSPLGDAVDVTGHEMTHGVTEKSAGLNYWDQSGALNESWSDTMGNLIQRWQYRQNNPGKPDVDAGWLVGEDIFTPGTDGDALRSESNPGHAYPGDHQPAHMKDYVKTGSDNGGVHTNSGIPNKAAWLLDQKVGDEKTGQIWYRAQTKYLTPNSKFVDAANGTMQAAADLYGKDSAEVTAVKESWAAVGLEPTAKPGIG